MKKSAVLCKLARVTHQTNEFFVCFFFRDIFPVLRKPDVFQELIDVMVDHIKAKAPNVELIVGLESRGFLFAPLIALRLNCGFAPVRKKGKLPGEKERVEYSLEYGTVKTRVNWIPIFISHVTTYTR